MDTTKRDAAWRSGRYNGWDTFARAAGDDGDGGQYWQVQATRGADTITSGMLYAHQVNRWIQNAIDRFDRPATIPTPRVPRPQRICIACGGRASMGWTCPDCYDKYSD